MDDHKMLAGSGIQLRQDACSIQIARQRVVPHFGYEARNQSRDRHKKKMRLFV